MCAKLRTMAASNNRVHPTRSLCCCLFAPHIYGVVLRAHSVRGESRIQRNASGEVATAPLTLPTTHFHTLILKAFRPHTPLHASNSSSLYISCQQFILTKPTHDFIMELLYSSSFAQYTSNGQASRPFRTRNGLYKDLFSPLARTISIRPVTRGAQRKKPQKFLPPTGKMCLT